MDNRGRSQTFSHHKRSRLGIKLMLNSDLRQRSGSTPLIYHSGISSRTPSKSINTNLNMSASETLELTRTRSKSKSDLFLEKQRLRSGSVKTKRPSFLELVDPFPVLPPPYEWIAPGKPKPVLSDCPVTGEPPPSYSPCVYKVAALMRKVEWLTPYQMANQRHWRTCLVELNSTQLNIYEYDPDEIFDSPSGNGNGSTTHSIFSLRSGHRFGHRSRRKSSASDTAGRSRSSSVSTNNDTLDSGDKYKMDDFRSTLTKEDDLERLKLFKCRGIMNKERLERSYTLQYGKVGLAIDYKKRRYVLRFRLQTEQFLLQFPSAALMIEWYTAVSTGIDNSLDLNRRPMPKYRTVPRRRRRHHNQENDHHHYQSFENFMRDPTPDLGNMMSHFKHKIKGALKTGTPMSRSSNSSSRSMNQSDQAGEDSGTVSSRYANSSNRAVPGNISGLHIQGIIDQSGDDYESDVPVGVSETGHPDEQEEDISSLHDILSSNSSENHYCLSAFEELNESGIVEPTSHKLFTAPNRQLCDESLENVIQTSSNSRNLKLAAGNQTVAKSVQTQPSLDIPLVTENSVSGSLIQTVVSNSSSISSANMASPVLVSSTPTTSISSNALSQTNVKNVSQMQARNDNNDEIIIPGFDMNEESISYVDFGEKLRPCTSLFTLPNKRRQIRDAIRCILPLLSTEKWTGNYLVKEASSKYKPETVWNLEYDPKKLNSRQLFSMERRYLECSFLQEYIVGEKDLVAKINYGFDDNRYCF